MALLRTSGPAWIPSLDGIRGVSFLIVFASHAGLGHIVPGAFGVTVFFFLSGFLIPTLMLREEAVPGRIGLGGFYPRGVFRIFPPMYLVLGIAVALAGVLDARLEG